MGDNQAARKVIKAGGSMTLIHLPRTHRIDAAAISEQFTRGVVTLQYERTQNGAVDIGTKRFTAPLAWVRVLYLVNIVNPKFWKVNRHQDFPASMFSDGLPLKPGGGSEAADRSEGCGASGGCGAEQEDA
eukprot:8010661-Pyramimonas_sp.AAC.1